MKFEAKKGDLPYSTLASYVDKEDQEQIKVYSCLTTGIFFVKRLINIP